MLAKLTPIKQYLVAISISDKTDLKKKNIIRNKEGRFIITKWSILRKYVLTKKEKKQRWLYHLNQVTLMNIIKDGAH